MKIKNKEDIINYFLEGNKLNQHIGIENEKFIFEKNTKKRSSYNQIVSVLNFLIENYDWKPVKENNNLIGLESNGKQVTLEPGNQIELAGAKLSNIHETCSESFELQDQLVNASNHLGLKLF